MGKDGKSPGILIFAGTTEGRLLAEYASRALRNTDGGTEASGKEQPFRCYVSVATDYGKSILKELEGISVHTGRMDQGQMREFIEENQISLVIDATHPFAREVTENIQKACEGGKTRYVRCVRKPAAKETGGKNEAPGGRESIIYVKSVREAVEYLKKTEGNILIATGSKELSLYTSIPDYRERCYARVLSTRAAVEESTALGFEGKHLIAMQGPFSAEMNLALLHQTEAACFVTKESGQAGGFEEKEEAAEKAGAVLVVIGRTEENGVSLAEAEEIIRRTAAGR